MGLCTARARRLLSLRGAHRSDPRRRDGPTPLCAGRDRARSAAVRPIPGVPRTSTAARAL
eukprot:scaffold5540_cov390-Prasinococcus_capsulatus_cf.AAC.10